MMYHQMIMVIYTVASYNEESLHLIYQVLVKITLEQQIQLILDQEQQLILVQDHHLHSKIDCLVQ